ncbi:MAG: hypothetical protein ACJ8FY_05600 [Gemmataceae bacterium]
MSFSAEEVQELAATFPGTEKAEEASVTYFRIPDVTLPDGCGPSPMTLLLCPSHVGGYDYRLFFAEKVKTPKDKNWNASNHILGQTWHAFSWQAKEKVSLTQMVARLLRALVCP